MADTNPAGQNLSAPLPAGQPPQPKNHRKRYMAALGAILVVAIGLGAYFIVGGQLFKGFIGKEYNGLKQCVKGIPEDILINSEYPVMVKEGCTVQLASDGDYAKFVYARFNYDQYDDGYTVEFTGETNLGDANMIQWYVDNDQIGTGPTYNHTFGQAGSYEVEMRISGEVNGKTVELVNSKTVVVVAPAPAEPAASTPAYNTSFGCTPAEGGQAPLTVTCTAVENGPNYYWDFDDDSAPEAASAGTTITHIYTNAGSYIVTYALTDGNDVILNSTTHPTITVTAATPEGPDLVAHWTFDEPSQSTFIDSTDNHNNAEIEISPGEAVVYEDGPVDKAANFETDKGIYAEVAYSEGGSLNLTGPFTAMVWVKTASPGVLFNKYQNVSNDNGYFVQLMDNGNIEFRTANSNANYSLVTTNQNILDDEWHPIAVVYGGSDQNADAIYVGGELATTGPGQFHNRSTILGVTERPFLIGKHSGTNPTPDTTFNGSLDDLRIYNGVMDATSINTIFLSSANPEGTPPPANSISASNFLEAYTPPAEGEETLAANFSITEQFNTASGHQVQLTDTSTGPIVTWIRDCDYEEGDIPVDDAAIDADPQLSKFTAAPILGCMYDYPDDNGLEDHKIALKVIDGEGNDQFVYQDTIFVSHPIQATVTCDPMEGEPPLEVHCSYSTNAEISNKNWNIILPAGADRDSPQTIATLSTNEIDYTLYTAQDYHINLSLIHNPSNAIFSKTIVIPVRENLLDSPTTIAPTGEISDTTPTFEWSAVEGANLYKLTVTDDDGIAFDQTDIAATSFTIPNENAFQVGEDYEWMVAAIDPQPPYAHYWSDEMSFTVTEAECADGLCGSAVEDGGGIDDNTVLMLHFENNLMDESHGGHVVKLGGSMSGLSQSYPKFGGYSVALGDKDFLAFEAVSGSLTFGSNDWTIDYWVKTMNVNKEQVIFTVYNGEQGVVAVDFIGGELGIYLNSSYTNTGYSPAESEWEHHAIVKNGTTVKLYVNGTEQFVADGISEMLSGEGISIGNKDYSLNGYIDEFRVSKGVARWTTNFTPPAAPYTEPVAAAVENAWTSRIASLLKADVFHANLDGVPALPANAFEAKSDATVKLITFAEPKENAVFVRFNNKQWDFDVKIPQVKGATPKDKKVTTGKDEEPPKLERGTKKKDENAATSEDKKPLCLTGKFAPEISSIEFTNTQFDITWEIDEKAVEKGLKGYDLKVGYYDEKGEYQSVTASSLDKYKGNSGSEIIGKLNESAKSYLLQMFALYNDEKKDIKCTGSGKEFTVQKAPEEKKEDKKVTTIKPPEKKDEDKKATGKDDEPPALQGSVTITKLSAKAIDAQENPDPDKEGKIPLQFTYETKGFLNPTDRLAWHLKDADGDAIPVYEASGKADNEPVIAWYAPGEYSYKLAILDADGKLRAEKSGGQILIVFKETGTPEPKAGTKAGETKEIAITITPEVVVGPIEPIVIPITIEQTIITKEITETVTVEGSGGGGGGGGGTYPQCSDNQNNDDDNFIDFPADPGCNNADDNTESPDPVTRITTQCSDGVDNDKNGVTDYPEDNGCINENDNSEETKFEIIASVEGLPEAEIADTIIKANNCLSKTPQNKITKLEDIKADHPAAEMIANLQKLAYNGEPIIVGRKVKDKYYFEDDKPILRPEFFKLAAWPSCLAQSASEKGLWDTKKVKNFKDKGFDEHWSREITNALANLGMVEGLQDGTAGLNKSITRAEILKLLLDAYALRVWMDEDEHDNVDFTTYDKEAILKEVFASSLAKYEKNPFPDISELNKPWFSNYAIIGYDLGIVNSDLFNGDKPATRLEAATMIYNFFIAKIKQQAEAVETVKEITFIRTFMTPRYGSF